MKASLLNFMSLSRGERGICTAHMIVAMFGAGLSFTAINRLGGHSDILRTLTAYDYWAILSGALGAASALYIGRRWLGQPGGRGLFMALCGIPVISFVGGLIGGTLALPIYGTMFGPMALAVTLYDNPIVTVLWVMNLLSAHYLFLIYRKERDTVFYTPGQDDDPILA